jgi:hypothetical protein
MRFTIIIFLIFIITFHTGYCQTRAKITEVDFHLEDNFIVVNYNLTGTLPKEQLTIQLMFINENNEYLNPKTVYNDVGAKIFGDGKKEIRWDLDADKISITGNLKAIVSITSSKVLVRGPSNALLSAIVPGLGGYFVDKNKTRSIITTVSTVGLMIYGINQKTRATRYYKNYNASSVNADIQNLYSKANNAQNKYFITTRIGAGLWVADIIWVYFKGSRNKKEAETYNEANGGGLSINYINKGFQFGYSMTF